MVGEPKYSPDEIFWVLDKVIQKSKPDATRGGFKTMFNKDLTDNQIRYIKNKYGKDPAFKYVVVHSFLIPIIPISVPSAW